MKFEPGEEKIQRMFEALSGLAARAFTDQRLVSNQVLAKSPHNWPLLRRYALGEPSTLPGWAGLLGLLARYYTLNLGHVCMMLLGRIALWASGLKQPTTDDRKTLVADTFMVLPRVAQNGRYDELYLPDLPQAAEQRGWRVIRLFRLYGSRNPLLLLKVFKILKTQGVEALTELHLLRAADWLRLLWHALSFPCALLRFCRSINPTDSKAPEAYIKEALLRSLGESYCAGESRRLVGRRLAEYLRPLLPSRAKVISWHENQPVNKGFYLGLAQARQKTGLAVPCLGAQLFIWPNSLLNNMADSAEKALGLTPDKVLVNGPYFLPEPGRPDYRVGPALRYGPLFAEANSQAGDEKPAELLVLLSYHPAEIRRALALLAPLAASGQALAYKFHPATRVEDYRRFLPANAKLVQGGLYPALRKAAAVAGCGSGSLAEAAALGVPVLNIGDPGRIAGLDLNYLPPFGQGRLWMTITNPDEAAPALRQLLAEREKPDCPELVRAFRDQLFAEPTLELIVKSFEL